MGVVAVAVGFVIATLGCCAGKGCSNGASAEGTAPRAAIEGHISYVVTLCRSAACGVQGARTNVTVLPDGTSASFFFAKADPSATWLSWSVTFDAPASLLRDGDVYTVTIADPVTHTTIFEYRSAPAHYQSVDPGCGGNGCRYANLSPG